MAEETPDNIVEEVGTAAAGAAGDDPTQSAEASGEPTGEAPAAAAPSTPKTQTRREKLEARREARRPEPRGPVTAEQREEERQARRAATAKQRRAYRAKLKERRAAAGGTGPARTEPAKEHGPGRPKVRQGVVTSAKGDKTITVKIDVVQRHRRYHKILRSTTKLYAHDEANTAGEGDTVRIVECRPMSRSKRWRLTDVLERAK
jgi:small subunit ribosomal protein S17